jgi:hypothetical protein
LSRIAFIGYQNYVKGAQAFNWFNPLHKSLAQLVIGCAESVPARKYKITRNPTKGALLSSEVFEPSSKPIGYYTTHFHVSNTLIVFNSNQMK